MELSKKILKKILPQWAINKTKVFLGEYPYVLRPMSFLRRRVFRDQLKDILGRYKDAKGIVIYPPTIDWHMPLFQRPQQLAKAFAESGYLFFYCTNNLRFDHVRGFEEIENGLILTDQAVLLKEIKNPVLFISWPFNRFFIDRFPGSKVVYDYIDELDVFDASGRTRDEMVANHEFLVNNSDLVVCTADKLIEDVKKLKPKKVLLAPNAVDLSHFEAEKKWPAPKDMVPILGLKKPIVGYYGAIAEWFDYDLLEKLAVSRSDLEFVMIGPFDYDKSLNRNKHLFEIKNIHFLGPKKYDELPAYLTYFDVATIPFVVNDITKATSPVKLFEYMAGGKPIVTSAMDECKKYECVLIAEGAKGFSEKIDQALGLASDKKYASLEAREAKENSWQKRVSDIMSLITC